MLFSIKNRLGPTLLLFVSLVAGCRMARAALHLAWRITPYPGFVRDAALGFGIIVASDALLHGTLMFSFGERYLTRYRALAEYFRRQGPLERGAGALLAGGEELFFRGVLLEGLMSRGGLGAGVSLGASALAFGALHRLRDRRLAPFALWAVWEGMVLGGLYMAFGSLLVLALVHTLHDLLGFALLARERRLIAAAAPTALTPDTGR
jgi:membrane protease YdiL (CAAX protease family)